MIAPKHGILFDLDGTLLDTADDLGNALNHVLHAHNMPLVASECYRPIASDGAKGLLELGFGSQLAHYDFEILRQQFLSFYEQNIANHTRLYPGVSELLKGLNALNIPWGIVTNKPEGLTLKLLPYFEEFNDSAVNVGGDTLAQRKPHPAPLLYACQQLAIAPQHCVYVGDANRDIEAGNSANMHTVVALWGYIKASDDCHQWQANKLCENPLELLQFTFQSS